MMRNMEKIKKNKEFIILFICYFILHSLTFEMKYDDLHFDSLENCSILEIISNIINSWTSNATTWSSRLFVNFTGKFAGALIVNTSTVFLFILNSLAYVLIVYSICKGICLLKSNYTEYEAKLISIGIIMIYPFTSMDSAGWICTSVSYLWPLAVMFYIVYRYIRHITFNDLKPSSIIIELILTIYATNMEGNALFFSILFIALTLKEKISKKVNSITIIYMILGIISVIWHLISPGNQNRALQEIARWFPNFQMLNIIDRVELVFSRMTAKLYCENNIMFLMFTISLTILVFERTDSIFYKTIAAFPSIITFSFTVISKLGIYEGIGNFKSLVRTEGTVRVENYDHISSYIFVLIGMNVMLCLFIELYILAKSITEFLILGSVLLGGIGAWMIMIFSPTIWVTSNRPITILYFAILTLCIYILLEIIKMGKIKTSVLISTIYVLATLNNLNCILL